MSAPDPLWYRCSAGHEWDIHVVQDGRDHRALHNDSEFDAVRIDTPAEAREELPSRAALWPAPPDEAAYHGPAGDIVRAIQPFTEADPVGLLGTFLAIFGTMAGDRWSLHQGEQQHTNIFVTLVGDTGTGRKGTAYSAISEVYKLVDKDWHMLLVTGLGSGEGLISFLKRREDDPRALVMESEFGHFLIAMTREGSTLSSIIRNAWDGVPLGRWIADPKKSGTIVRHHVGMLANITDIELAQRLTSTEAANGFGNRFLWLSVRRDHLLPFTEPLIAPVTPHLKKLKDALAFADKGGFMHYSPEAREIWKSFYMRQVPRMGLLGALIGRREPYIARLAMIYALLDCTATIGVEHLLAAAALWDYADHSTVYIFGDSTGDRHADALLKMLGEKSPLPWLEIIRERHLKPAEMDSAVGILTRLGLVREVRIARPGGGRPRREIELIAQS